MSKLLRDIPVEKHIAKHMHWFERKAAEWRQLPARRAAGGPYLTISRELGSGGDAVARLVAEKLGWPLFDREIIEAIAEKTHVREELVAQFDEHVRSAFDTYLQNLYTGRIFDAPKYLYHLSQVLLGIVELGQAVILGRGANLILPSANGLRARIVAPHALRVKNLMRERAVQEKEAAQLLAAHAQEQKAFFQRYFHNDPNDPVTYDVVVNTEGVAPERVAKFLARLLAAKVQIPA